MAILLRILLVLALIPMLGAAAGLVLFLVMLREYYDEFDGRK